MTIKKYLVSYLYSEYFQKSNLVLIRNLLNVYIVNPETESKSHSHVSHPQYKTLPLQQPTLY